jgi:dihydroflavonol-4-reductase
VHTLITGATGLIGNNIASELLLEKRKLRALVRDIKRAEKLIPPGIELVQGDVTDFNSVKLAMQGIQAVYHCSGLPEQWLKDPDVFQQVNVNGTENVLKAAKENKVEKFIYTSTIDVFKGAKGQVYNESTIDSEPKGTYYERSKQDADRIAVRYLNEGMNIIFLHPAGLYGIGESTSPGMNQLIIDLANDKVPMLLPGGVPLVFSRDVAIGHILAEKKGKAGDRFILSESYLSLQSLAEIIIKKLGKRNVPRVMPLPIAKLVSLVTETYAQLSGKPPLLPKGQLHFLQWEAIPDSSFAKQKLGWNPINLDKGLEITIQHLKDKGKL